MPSTDEHIQRLQEELSTLKCDLSHRLEKLEGARKKPVALGGRLLDIFAQALVPIISGAVILLLGYAAKDSVDQALRREQLHLAYAEKMQQLLVQLRAPDASRESAEAAALTLATFGAPAVPPLVNALQYEGNTALAAESGLRGLALTAPEAACQTLERVLTNRTRLFRWETHLRSLRLLGDLDCRSALPTLQNYRSRLAAARAEDQFKSYAALLHPESRPDQDNLTQLRDALDQSLLLLR